MSKPIALVRSLDHLVLTCASIPRTAQWYSRYLGMKVETFKASSSTDEERVALKYGSQKINLHQKGKEFEPKAQVALPGTADMCFVLEDKANIDQVLRGFKDEGIAVLEGGEIVSRTGAQGPIRSVYVRDPDGNLIELSKYEQ